MKLWPDQSSGCNYAPFHEEKGTRDGRVEVDPPTSPRVPPTPSPALTPETKRTLKRTMSLSSFHIMQTLKNSPAAFRRRFRKDRTESLSHGDPLFKVHYLGTEKIFSLDREQAQDAISRLLDAAANGKKLGKDHALVVRPRYVEVKELSTGRQLTKTYLQDIAYCAADASRPNVFLYICKQRGQQLQCRVFWCSRAERARDMTACLAQSFQQALSDWQQDGSATLNPDALMPKAGEERPVTPTTPRSSTLPASLGKARWKKRGSLSRSPLRAITRRGSSADSWN
ncbi:low density lipoprotein receptor adapter protein 1 [Aplochiton taeniatus]